MCVCVCVCVCVREEEGRERKENREGTEGIALLELGHGYPHHNLFLFPLGLKKYLGFKQVPTTPQGHPPTVPEVRGTMSTNNYAAETLLCDPGI